ncbi:NifU family protein [Patescibacteria group bacterium]
MSKQSLKQQVEQALKEVKPYIESHGGGFDLVSVKNGKVKIQIKGACLGCPMAQATFGAGMEEMIKEKVPEVKEVEFIQD